MNKTIQLYLLLISTLFLPQGAKAQCKIMNNSFKDGESIVYDLYFNYGIVNAKAGVGSLKTDMVNYKDNSAYNLRMLLNTTGLPGSIYTVNDTLVSYIDMDLRPLLFTKNAFEGKDYSREVQSFSYTAGDIKVRTSRIFNGKKKFEETIITNDCTYDYLSVLALIRNLDYSGMKPGDQQQIKFLSGREIVNMAVNYNGTSNIKANDGKTYNTIQISLTIYDKAFKNQKEAISASLTDDSNRIPIVINTHLKIGVIRAVLKNVTGLRN
ncbi:MAG TPA: DUF3108 domain-containing protein [Petrimonas sp.]|nr:DUF3108 domain-containing protein [Petrimonas sp.]OJV33049.1 MAG: hypothetical protein BGO33_00770 [Bacteroidia bacterium 43-41]HHV86112.1 DUF3108 domain-containing protein [Petrimonas sp.]